MKPIVIIVYFLWRSQQLFTKDKILKADSFGISLETSRVNLHANCDLNTSS